MGEIAGRVRARVLVVIGPAGVSAAFFVGAAVFAAPLIADAGPLRWPAVVLLVGTLLNLAEIISSQVLLGQIGNFLVRGGSAAFAWLLVRGEVGAPAGAGAGEALRAGEQLRWP